MDGIKGGGGGGRVGVGEDQDMADGMQCSDHPYRNNPGGICAFCLQEKLGKLVSSSFPLPIRLSSSSSSSPSFRSDLPSVSLGAGAGILTSALAATTTAATTSSSSLSLSLSVRASTKSTGPSDGGRSREYCTRRARIPFLMAKKKKKIMAASSDHRPAASDVVFKRSKSTHTPRTRHFFDVSASSGTDDCHDQDFSPRKRGGFWSFLYLSSSKSASTKKMERVASMAPTVTNGSVMKSKEKCLVSSLSKKGGNIVVVEEDDDSPSSQATVSASASSFERKVSRSRSVGCGSRSFSGDFFERISTGLGDCTLRRVESQREGKPKVSCSSSSSSSSAMKERVKCGGIFSGFIMTSSSSSSSSSSYWVSTSAEEVNGKSNGVVSAGPGALSHGRSRSWTWAFASPMRAFSRPSSKDGKREHTIREANSKNTPNLSAIPSLLAVRS